MLRITLNGRFKYLLAGVVSFISFIKIVAVSHALDYYGSDTVERPHPIDIVVPFARIFTAFIIFAGAVFIFMVVYGAIKMAMATGKARELEGSKLVLTYAVFGFVIIMAFFTIVSFLAGALGIPFLASPSEFFDTIQEGIMDLIEATGIVE